MYETPTLDRWMYPFNTSPGDQWFASIFGATLEDGFSPDFDNRDGQMIVGFDTTSRIAPGQGPASYQISAAILTLTVKSDGTFEYDPTPDPYTSWLQPGDPDFEADPDPGRPLELFGAGFRGGWDAATFEESSPFCNGCSCFPPNQCVENRNVYAIDFVPAGAAGGGCVERDVSNNVRDEFDPTPWAVGTTASVAPGDPVPAGTELTFVIDLADACVDSYWRQALDAGVIDLVVASLFPASQQQEGPFPRMYTKEDPLAELGVVIAARLEVTVQIGVVGDVNGDGIVGIGDLLLLLAAWGPCPPEPCDADLDGDDQVGITDLLLLLANWSG